MWCGVAADGKAYACPGVVYASKADEHVGRIDQILHASKLKQDASHAAAAKVSTAALALAPTATG